MPNALDVQPWSLGFALAAPFVLSSLQGCPHLHCNCVEACATICSPIQASYWKAKGRRCLFYSSPFLLSNLTSVGKDQQVGFTKQRAEQPTLVGKRLLVMLYAVHDSRVLINTKSVTDTCRGVSVPHLTLEDESALNCTGAAQGWSRIRTQESS